MSLVGAVSTKQPLAAVCLLVLLLTAVRGTVAQSLPENLFPVDGQAGVSLNPTLEITCPAGGVVAAQYMIAPSPTFTPVLYDSGEHVNDVCSHVAFTDLEKGELYYWRARMKNSSGTWSAWSAATSFTTTTAPSVFINVFQDGFSGYTGTRDADIRGNALDPTGPPIREWNQGTQDVLRTGRRVPKKTTDEIYRTLLKFDLTSLTDPDAVMNAYLELTGWQHGSLSENLFFMTSNSLYEVLQSWGEGTGLLEVAPLPGEVSWTYSESPIPWVIPGAGYASDSDPNADRKASPLVRKIVTNQVGHDTVWSSQAFIELVKKWIVRPDLNHGFLLRADDELLQRTLHLASREHTDMFFRPRLVVESTEPAQALGNQPPLAGHDTVSTDAGVAVQIAVLSNDSDPDHGPASLSITHVGAPNHGTTQIISDDILYTPTAGFVGTDTFSYTLTDGVASAIATVTVTVNAALTAPVITSFTAVPMTIGGGEGSTLSWSTTAADSVTLTPAGGSGLPPAGSLVLTPTQTTTYTLTATNAAGTVSATVIVTVTAAPTPAPTITSFTALPTTIVAGEGSTLSWHTTAADSVTLTPAGGSGLPPAGSLVLTPTQTTTYTLTATGPGGTTSATLLLTVTPPSDSPTGAGRITTGLVAYYPLTEGSGPTAANHAPSGAPLPLTLSGAVTWHPTTNGVVLAGGVLSSGSATPLVTALQRTNQLSVELWLTPAVAFQMGPARLVSLRGPKGYHDMMLGHRRAEVESWLKHSAKGSQNAPWLETTGQALATRLVHVVHTFDGSVERLYIDGVERASQTLSGTLTQWYPEARLYVGNELTLDRAWQGTLHLLALYDRALPPADIQHNFAAGPTSTN